MTNIETRTQIKKAFGLSQIEIMQTQEVIYKSDYKALRDALTSAMDGELDAATALLSHEQYQLAYQADTMGPYLHTVASKYAKARAVGNLSAKYTAVLGEWTNIYCLYADLASKVVTTRKPALLGRTSPVRTLDQTGTCPVCQKNVKLDSGGKIVKHGYKVKYQAQHGECPGVGYQPWELSTEGALAYIKTLEAKVAELNATDAKMQVAKSIPCWIAGLPHKRGQDSWEDTDTFFALAKSNVLRNIEHDIRGHEWSIRIITKLVEKWTLMPLPKEPNHSA